MSDTNTEEHRYEVGVEDRTGEYHHFTITAETPQDAMDEGENRAASELGFDTPEAYQAYDLEEMKNYE